jgi:hypothetical protein
MTGASAPLADTVGTNTLTEDGIGTGSPIYQVQPGAFDNATGVEIQKITQGLQAQTLDAATFPNGIVLEVQISTLDNSLGNNTIWEGNGAGFFRQIKRVGGYHTVLTLSYRDVADGNIFAVDILPENGLDKHRRLVFFPDGSFGYQTPDGSGGWNAFQQVGSSAAGIDFYNEVLANIHQGPRAEPGSGNDTDYLRVFKYDILSID